MIIYFDITLAFMLLTMLILIIGVVVMAVGGKINKKHANKLMSLRVIIQSLTLIILAFLTFMFKK
jgi:uncharacterized membrane protein YdjX (TVP38/TMEM64 family)